MEIKTKNDLDELIKNKIAESTILEYKAPFPFKDNSEIAKDVSAMANSEGGIIIYGISERESLPEKIIWISDPSLQGKIDQVIQSAIVPKVDYKLKIINSPEKKEEFVLAVEISKSDIAPHQAYRKDGVKKYYRRNGARIREMEHYEIEDLFFKRKRPVLRIGLRNVSKNMDKLAFDIYLGNAGKIVAEQAYIKLVTPPGYQIDGWSKKEYSGGYSAYEHLLKDVLVYPGLNQVIGTIYYPKNFEFGALKLPFLMICRDMELLEGEIFIDFRGKLKVTYGVSEIIPLSQEKNQYIFSDSQIE